jgi:hypothetical protein
MRPSASGAVQRKAGVAEAAGSSSPPVQRLLT